VIGRLQVKNTGQNKSILTFYELVDGDLAQSTGTFIGSQVDALGQLALTDNVSFSEHRGLPEQVLRQALSHLSKTGKAQVFTGEEGVTGGEGVKFV
jgi:hypothetical protein